MIRYKIVILAFILLNTTVHSIKGQEQEKNIYLQAYEKINEMLEDKLSSNFKYAVFTVEKAYVSNSSKEELVNQELEILFSLIKETSFSNFSYKGKDEEIVTKQATIFKFLNDTIVIPVDSAQLFIHTPYTYDFSDPFGEKDWTKMFVSKLLETGKGNCHSLPYLYKILADELGIPAYLAFAPNHIYIKSYSEKTGWYNTELTSGTFPIDAWIMASGYVTLEAIQNGLYMDTLSNKQAVANCLVDLAQGYQRKFGKDNSDFVIKCCNTCLEYHPVNVNAMLTKAEAQKHYILKQMETKKLKKPQDLFSDVSIKEMYEDMEQTYVKLHQLGYRRMPEEMYLQWMNSLRNEPTKYNNPKVSVNKKRNKN